MESSTRRRKLTKYGDSTPDGRREVAAPVQKKGRVPVGTRPSEILLLESSYSPAAFESDQTYAAIAFACSAVIPLPPFGSIGIMLSFGAGTPSLIVFSMAANEPSLWSHVLSARLGAIPEPSAAWP